jgi:putative ABC transport system substrate-binding protein
MSPIAAIAARAAGMSPSRPSLVRCNRNGDSLTDLYRRAAFYVDKIFKGAKPADLPIQQPTRFYTAINRKTAEALALTIPLQLLVLSDEVIE